MKIKLLVALLAVVPILVLAELPRTTNSPYTQYGYGELSDPSYGAQKAMGGIGYGLREKHMINPANPASFSCVDSMTFMFDVAISGQLSMFNDGSNKSKNTNAHLEYVAIQVPLFKNWGMGLGIKPVSQVGYKFGVKEENSSVISYTGSGGLNQVYGTLSYKFKNISVGLDAAYLFGGKYHSGNIGFADKNADMTLRPDTLVVSGLVFDVGVQYTQPIGKDKRMIVGAVYTPKLPLNGNYLETKIRYSPISGQKYEYERTPFGDLGYDLPETYAIGFSYAQTNKFLAGADYTFQKWSDVRFHGKTNVFNDRSRINAGCEFLPNARGREYFGRVRYRLGGNYANSYTFPNEENSFQLNEYGVSLGFGFPLSGGRSLLNMAFEYTKTTPKQQLAGSIKEEYFKFTISYTFNEMWFFQRKVQ